jgi:hypothetical protein
MGLDLVPDLFGHVGWAALAESNPLLPPIDHIVPDFDRSLVLSPGLERLPEIIPGWRLTRHVRSTSQM